jgi:hypothetical protein
MPLLKKIEPPEGDSWFDGLTQFKPGRSLGDLGASAYEAVHDAITRALGVPDRDKDDPPRVGEYYADYSQLTPEEIGRPDPEAEALFKRSKPISR